MNQHYFSLKNLNQLMFQKSFSSFLVLLITLLACPNGAMAETIIRPRTFYPSKCHVQVDSLEADCVSITFGLLSNKSEFNIKLCDRSNDCLVLIGQASELEKYPYPMTIYSVAWMEGSRVIKRWSGYILFGSYQDGFGIAGTLEGSVLVAYFEI